MPPQPIYLDHAATTPIRPEVLEAMMPYLTGEFGNPSAVYGPGRRARHVIEKCRAQVAEILGVGSAEVLFTSGGSESNNTVLSQPFSYVVSSEIEHDSVRVPLSTKANALVAWVPSDAEGRITPAQLSSILEAEAPERIQNGLVSLMTVNNELGSINPIQTLSEMAHSRGMLFHTDAVQAAGIIELSSIAPHVDYLSLSGHKIGAPKGVGVLSIRAGSPFRPFIRGGSQEQDRRAGTENVASIVGFCAALQLAANERDSAVRHMIHLREHLVSGLMKALPGQVLLNGPTNNEGAPHILSMTCTDQSGLGLDGEMLILGLDISGVYVSAGSACSSGTVKANTVLLALGMKESLAKGAIRISLSSKLTLGEIDTSIARIKETINRMTGRAFAQGRS